MRPIVLVLCSALAACGGRPEPVRTIAISASGPIRAACLAGGRRAADPALCGCIQAVADQTLSGGEQRAAVAFFDEPHLTQELRQSDDPNDEAFWLRWKAFGAQATETCEAAA